MNSHIQDAIEEWFTGPYDTVLEAQSLSRIADASFCPCAVWKTPDGKFVFGQLNSPVWDIEAIKAAAEKIYEITGLVMVSHCEPLLGVWHKIEVGDDNE